MKHKIFVSVVLLLFLGSLAGAQVRPQERVSDFREISDQRRQEIRQGSVEIREQAENIRTERVEEARDKQEEFQARTMEIRNEQRRMQARILAENINRANERLSLRFFNYLDAMDLVLDKIESNVFRIEEARELELVQTRESILSAGSMIEEAREKLLEQGTFIYVVDLQSEETIRDDFARTINQLQEDYRALREEMIVPLQSLIRDVMLVLRDEIQQAE